MAEQAPPDSYDALAVLTRAGASRDAFCAEIGEAADVDAQLVSELLRQAGRVGDTLQTRRALVELCVLVRAIDAALAERITLAELRSGLAMHAARTDRFDAFHDARVLLRTLTDVLDQAAGEQPALRAQVAYLHDELRGWLLEQLTGSPAGVIHATDPMPEHADPDPRATLRISDRTRRIAADAVARELLHGADHYPVTGLLGAAWRRDWAAVPIPGDQLGDDPEEVGGLLAALEQLGIASQELLQVERQPAPRWQLDGARLIVGDGLRRAWAIPLTDSGLEAASGSDRRRAATILTTDAADFAYVEDDGWHALLGPRSFVEQALGRPQLEAIAAFREWVEEQAVEGEPPPDLLQVAMSYGRLRRRAR